jgi:hypothetical protein
MATVCGARRSASTTSRARAPPLALAAHCVGTTLLRTCGSNRRRSHSSLIPFQCLGSTRLRDGLGLARLGSGGLILTGRVGSCVLITLARRAGLYIRDCQAAPLNRRLNRLKARWWVRLRDTNHGDRNASRMRISMIEHTAHILGVS